MQDHTFIYINFTIEQLMEYLNSVKKKQHRTQDNEH